MVTRWVVIQCGSIVADFTTAGQAFRWAQQNGGGTVTTAEFE